MKEKQLVFAAKVLSVIFTPFYLPVGALVGLLAFSYLSLLPWTYKLFLLLMFWVFTVFLPTTLINLYRRSRGWTFRQLGNRERRAIPYIISILSYLLCCYIMTITHVPRFMRSILMAALVIQIACAAANIFIKISTHTAAIGGVAGAITAFSLIFSFNPVWWLCVIIILSGMVGTSRMVLRQHSLHEVLMGFLLGVLCSFVSVLVY